MTATADTAPAAPPAVCTLDPCSDPRWERLACSPDGSLFTAPPWLRAIRDTYAFTPRAHVLVNRGAPVAGLVSVDLDDHRGRRRSAAPFCDRADPIGADARTWPALAGAVLADGTPFTLRCLDAAAAGAPAPLRRSHEAAWHATTVGDDTEALFARLHPAARRNVRAAQRHGVVVEADTGPEAVHAFFDLHRDLRRRKYRLLAQPRAFFERIWAEFAPTRSVVTILARIDGQPVAGALLLVWNGVLYYKFGASRQEHLDARPNDAVFWAALRWAVAHRLGLLDWGLSELDQQGLVGYKRKWADVERRIHTLTTAVDRPCPTPPMVGTLSELTALLTADDVPDHVTERAGALLYRYFC